MAENGTLSREWETKHPGWVRLSALPGAAPPIFESILFLPGYEFSSNIYVVAGAPLSIVDAGNDYTAFAELFAMGYRPADIGKIVLTHGHRDHAMGVFELLRSYSGVVEGGKLELVVHEAGPAELRDGARRAGVRVTEVRGGETIELGGCGWEVILTPGHTVDGICLYHAPSRTAFTGDTVLPHAMSEPDENAGGRFDHYLFGLRALLEREIENVLPGHGLPVAGAGKRVIEDTYEGLMLKVVGAAPDAKIRWVDGAAALAEKGFLHEAVFCCEKGLRLAPADRRALRLAAACLNDLGRFREALETLDRLDACAAGPERDLFSLVGRGYALMGLARYQESVALFDEALKLRPGATDASVYKGMALYLAGRCDEAMEIEPFRTEFMGRFRDEVMRRAKSRENAGDGAAGSPAGGRGADG